MKIGIATIHHAKFSYGACLQAVAMCRVCEKFANTVEIINYENKYEQNELKYKGKTFVQKIKQILNYYARFYLFGMWKNPYRDPKKLDSLYGCVTSKYHSVDEMKNLKYDLLVCGSDQIWNPEIMGEFDPFFMLDFGVAGRRISYAASMGSYVPSNTEKKQLQYYLRKFDSISVREIHAKDQLQSLTDNEIKVVVDPTLLLTGNEWRKIFSPPANHEKNANSRYILCFFVWNGISSYIDDVRRYADALNLPIWNIQSHSRKVRGVDRVIQVPSVQEFLELIDSAELIITNSFHGIAFSINYKKNFVPLLNKKNPARVQNLLSELELSNLIEIEPEKCMSCINYDKVQPLLDRLREDSLQWLKQAITGITQ